MNSYIDPAHPVELPLNSSDRSSTPLSLADGPLTVDRSVLPGGVRLLTENVPGTRSATIGLWVSVGSRDEEPQQAGASHFLEHLLFKGTKRRSAMDIATAFDAVGGESNAATAKETTHYWARVLDTDSPMAVATLTDMVTSSVLADSDIETERTVIIDELAMSDDSPAEVAHEAFSLAVHGDTAMGRPIGGTIDSVKAVTGEDIRALYQERYASSSLIIAAAGNVDHSQISEQVEQALSLSSWSRDPLQAPEPRRNTNPSAQVTPEQREIVIRRDVEQTHILVGGEWLNATDNRRPISTVLMTILGGGMSSRLFQEIREKRGLAYTTYSFDIAYADTGMFGMYAGCAGKNVAEVEKIMWAEVERLAAGDLTEEEIDRAKGQLRGGVALGLEDSASRMSRLGRTEIIGRFVSVDDALERIQVVQHQDIVDVAAQMLRVPRSRAVVTENE